MGNEKIYFICSTYYLLIITIYRHGGSGAAIYAEKNFIDCIQKTNEWKAYLLDNEISTLSKALEQAFINIDAAMREYQESGDSDRSGCTSVTCMVTPTHIICANAGDSRCVFGRNSISTIAMSDDHKPYNEGEKRRIENAGGSVQFKRVDGDLAVSRALGDFQYKRKDQIPIEQKVSCVPDIRVELRTAEDDILLLACDGLWDVMSNEDATAKIREIYASGEDSAMLIAEEMLDCALDKGSRDNISAIVVKFQGAKIGPKSSGGVTGIREARLKQQQSQLQGSNPTDEVTSNGL